MNLLKGHLLSHVAPTIRNQLQLSVFNQRNFCSMQIAIVMCLMIFSILMLIYSILMLYNIGRLMIYIVMILIYSIVRIYASHRLMVYSIAPSCL